MTKIKITRKHEGNCEIDQFIQETDGSVVLVFRVS